MPLSVSNPRDLILVGLGDLLFVERLLSHEVLPELLKQVSDAELTEALSDHLGETKRHVEVVERAFRSLDAEPSSNHSLAFGGLREQHDQVASSVIAPALGDVWHATAAVHTEHYEIAGYRQLRGLAQATGRDELDGLLAENLGDEERALERLREVSEHLAANAAKLG